MAEFVAESEINEDNKEASIRILMTNSKASYEFIGNK